MSEPRFLKVKRPLSEEQRKDGDKYQSKIKKLCIRDTEVVIEPQKKKNDQERKFVKAKTKARMQGTASQASSFTPVLPAKSSSDADEALVDILAAAVGNDLDPQAPATASQTMHTEKKENAKSRDSEKNREKKSETSEIVPPVNDVLDYLEPAKLTSAIRTLRNDPRIPHDQTIAFFMKHPEESHSLQLVTASPGKKEKVVNVHNTSEIVSGYASEFSHAYWLNKHILKNELYLNLHSLTRKKVDFVGVPKSEPPKAPQSQQQIKTPAVPAASGVVGLHLNIPQTEEIESVDKDSKSRTGKVDSPGGGITAGVLGLAVYDITGTGSQWSSMAMDPFAEVKKDFDLWYVPSEAIQPRTSFSSNSTTSAASFSAASISTTATSTSSARSMSESVATSSAMSASEKSMDLDHDDDSSRVSVSVSTTASVNRVLQKEAPAVSVPPREVSLPGRSTPEPSSFHFESALSSFLFPPAPRADDATPSRTSILSASTPATSVSASTSSSVSVPFGLDLESSDSLAMPNVPTPTYQASFDFSAPISASNTPSDSNTIQDGQALQMQDEDQTDEYLWRNPLSSLGSQTPR